MPKEDYGNVEITYDMLADRGKRFANSFIDYIIYIFICILFKFYFNNNIILQLKKGLILIYFHCENRYFLNKKIQPTCCIFI